MTRFALAVVFLAISATAFAQQADPDAAIVRQFYPPELAEHIDPEHPVQSFRYVRADLDGTGRADYIAAVYYNGANDVLRILRIQNGMATVACDPDDLPGLGYLAGYVTAVDLNGDGRQELVLTIPTERSSTDWVLQWKDGGLSIVSPVTRDSRGIPSTLLGPIQITDIDGDGIPEVLDWMFTGERAGTWVAYKLGRGKMDPVSGTLLLAKRVVRTKGEPDEFDFLIQPNGPGPYRLRVVNGDLKGRHRVTAAEVYLNGAVLVPESAFKNSERVMTCDLDLRLGGALFVSLRSAPDSELTIVVVQGQ